MQKYIYLKSQQLLRRNHLDYTITFIRTKVDALDKVVQPGDKDKTIQLQPLASGTKNSPTTHLYIGSFKDRVTLTEFVEHSAGNGWTYREFRQMLEVFLNRFYDIHQLPREGYLRVKGDQEVISQTLLVGSN